MFNDIVYIRITGIKRCFCFSAHQLFYPIYTIINVIGTLTEHNIKKNV